jgi:hypothetical protein
VTEPLDVLSPSGKPPDEVAAAVKTLSREIDAVNTLRTELQAAEQSRLIGIAVAVVGVILAVLVGIVLIKMR